MAVTKLKILNDALASTGNLLIAQDGLDALDPSTPITDENSTLYVEDRASRAYDRELPLLLERHAWAFAKATEALDPAGDAENPSNRYGKAYYWPMDALWLQKVEMPGGFGIDYEIIGQFICMDYDGTGGDAPVATYVQSPARSDVTSNLFWEILRVKIEVSLLRSINEDYSEASRRDQAAESLLLPIVRTRVDQQSPARRAFHSTMRDRRRGAYPGRQGGYRP